MPTDPTNVVPLRRTRQLVARQASPDAPAPEPSTTGAPVVAFAPPAAVDPRYAEYAANWRRLRAALIDDLAGLPHEDLARLSWEVAKLARRGGAA